ncbi:hypothetical protein D3C81_1490900 [compost metagenome]
MLESMQESFRGLIPHPVHPRFIPLSRFRSHRIFDLLKRVLQPERRAEPMGKIFLKGRLLHVFLTKFRKHCGYVAVKHRIRREKNDLIRPDPAAVLIEQVGHPLQRSGRLPAPGRPLHDEHTALVVTDNRVLLLLNRRHDALHL